MNENSIALSSNSFCVSVSPDRRNNELICNEYSLNSDYFCESDNSIILNVDPLLTCLNPVEIPLYESPASSSASLSSSHEVLCGMSTTPNYDSVLNPASMSFSHEVLCGMLTTPSSDSLDTNISQSDNYVSSVSNSTTIPVLHEDTSNFVTWGFLLVSCLCFTRRFMWRANHIEF